MIFDIEQLRVVDLAGPEIPEQPLQGRAVERGARQATVVIVIGDEPPSLVGLALDVGLAGLALGIERIEVLLKTLVAAAEKLDKSSTVTRIPVPLTFSFCFILLKLGIQWVGGKG